MLIHSQNVLLLHKFKKGLCHFLGHNPISPAASNEHLLANIERDTQQEVVGVRITFEKRGHIIQVVYDSSSIGERDIESVSKIWSKFQLSFPVVEVMLEKMVNSRLVTPSCTEILA